MQLWLQRKVIRIPGQTPKEGAGVGKRDVQNYLRKQQKEAKEPVNNAFAKALEGLKL